MEVKERYNVTGVAEGKHETLDVKLPLFVGGTSNFNVVKNSTGFTHGFAGKIFSEKIARLRNSRRM